MFTGLVQTKSFLINSSSLSGGARRLVFSHQFTDLNLGESIAVDGACLTVTSFDVREFSVDLSPETLELTSLDRLAVDDEVNLERALQVGDRLGGHLVSGHVDGQATIEGMQAVGEMTELTLRLPKDLAPYVATKGSLTVAGVSLTTNRVQDTLVELLLIPHTLAATTLGSRKQGEKVNIEIDLVARYVERLLESRSQA